MQSIEQNNLPSLLESLVDLDKKGTYSAVGLNAKTDLTRLEESLNNHKLGVTPRALLIYVRGYLLDKGIQYSELTDEDFEAFLEGAPSSSSISRAIAYMPFLRETLKKTGKKAIQIIELGAGKAQASRMFLHPELFAHEFFQWRIEVNPSDVPNVTKVFGVDNRAVSTDETTLVYRNLDAKMDLYNQLAKNEEEDIQAKRYLPIIKDIRETNSADFENLLDEDTAVVVILSNVLYQLASEEMREAIKSHASTLAQDLNGTLLQMETSSTFNEEIPEILHPDMERPLPTSGIIKVNGVTRAYLNGTTGKPFVYLDKDGNKIYVDKNNNETQI